MEDPEALPQRRRQHAGPRGGRHQGERPEGVLEGARVHPLVHDEVDGEVFHRGIQQLLDRPWEPMDLVDEEHVVLAEVGQDAHQVTAALDRRPGGGHERRAHLVGDDPGERGLAEPGRTVQEHVVHALAAELGRLDRDPEARDRLLLADVLLERAGPQLALELRLFRRRHPAHDLALVGRRRAHRFSPR